MENLKNCLTIILLFLVFSANAQFIHLNVDEESKDPVTIIFEDGIIHKGFIKNNKPKNTVLRVLAVGFGSNGNAMSNPDLVVNSVLFKETESDEDYKEIDVMKIKQVVFHNQDNLTYDRTVMYDINAKTLKVDYSNPKKMFFIANDLSGFKRYRIFVKTSQGNSKSGIYTPYYYAKHPTKNEVVYMNPWSMVIYSNVINYFKFIGQDCPSFVDYLEKLKDEKSQEYKDFKKIKKEFKAQVKKTTKEEAKDNKKNKISNNYLKQEKSARYYEMYFNLLYQKYISLGCES